MPSVQKLQALQDAHISVHKKGTTAQEVSQVVDILTSALQKIQAIMANPHGSKQEDLEGLLSEVSKVFRNSKFSTVLKPALEAIANDPVHQELWKKAKIGDTQMPRTPGSFENIQKSTPQSEDTFGRIVPLVKDREIAFLAIYGITNLRLGEIFHALRNPE